MQIQKIDYVKGHMGGNEIVLLKGDQIQEGHEKEVAFAALDPPNIRGHQAGLLYRSTENEVRVEIVSVTPRGFISSCGGLTQVLGKVMVETDFLREFALRLETPLSEVDLETDAGIVKLQVEHHARVASRVWTSMKPFVNECYRLGVVPMEVAGVRVMKVGKVLVINGDELRQRFSSITLKRIDEATIRTLSKVQQEFITTISSAESSEGEKHSYTPGFAIYDLNPKEGGDGRVIFPHDVSIGHIEPSCGTGAAAVGITMWEKGEVQTDENEVDISLESGGSPSTIGGPDLTKLILRQADGKVMDARFSHSNVKILAEGKIWIE